MTTFRRELIPAGSHLSLAVYSTRKTSEAVFGTMVQLVRGSVESSARYVEVAPRSAVDDESVEVQRVLAEIDFGENGVPADLPTDPGQVPIRAYVRTKRFGPIVIERVMVFDRTLRERQAVEAHLADDELGIPPGLWSGKDRRRALARYDWASELFKQVCVRSDALYGHLANEATLPTPAQIHDGLRVEGAVFLSAEIIGSSGGFVEGMKARYGQNVVTELENGVVLDGLVQFGKTGVTFQNSAEFTAEITEFLSKKLRAAAR
ncbi:hypothetical protein [Amycolatopsis sp. BJA-103]|uniref:hypothetical protein n=1 Tax=Amycolatopsis sp. BJA-103 TaxID=1911175 RepID=UPI000C76B48D|nr:hypothetical protein [Amycolatopsis sp. BJA-103]AUI59060.1 hypothetical protein BKN51_13145 [Amycolatopsis sp. BJA-103]PNE17492.1 hypothetical protein B1H26_21380 [Amycolatopsis sp. BJA-103]